MASTYRPMASYSPAGDGTCVWCNQDVRRHKDPAHPFVLPIEADGFTCDAVVLVTVDGAEGRCGALKYDACHDVGRVLRCPKDAR